MKLEFTRISGKDELAQQIDSLFSAILGVVETENSNQMLLNLLYLLRELTDNLVKDCGTKI